MRYLASLVSVAVFASVMLMNTVSVQAGESSDFGNLANGRKIFKQGKGDAVPACQSCHGASGLGSDDLGTPRLADQVFTYELKQLDDFAADKRTDNTLGAMNDIAKGLTPQERRDVATYVHTLKSPFAGSDLRALKGNGVAVGDRARGQMIVEYGLDGIPACKSCHGFHGRSAGRIFPALYGQRYVYLTNQLGYWRDKSRHNDPMQMMEKVAAKLSDKDIHDVAAFLTGAVPYTKGNPHPIPRENF
ncbi:MAG TPA: c-type cytochrome [Mariprofundaceae bacterium]|nr:c-type cytochrome [Mariprofundaceae bacterium]